MANSTEANTAYLDVTLQVNQAWVKKVVRPSSTGAQLETAHSTAEADTMLLCSDIITVDDELRKKPQFDMTTYVMDHAIAHTIKSCA